MDKSINILLAISNNILREGLSRIILASGMNVLIVSSADDAEEPQPDLIIFDIHQPIRKLCSLYQQAKPILLDSGIDQKNINFLLMSHRVRGIIAPDENVEMFYKALRVVNNGDIWIDQKHLKALLKDAGNVSKRREPNSLSDQDNKIISFICKGKKNREIADTLCLSEHTIKSHVSRIYKNLNVKNRAQLVKLAQNSMLCDLDD